ncbi:protein kinase domain-containing protein [Polyangium jinanense]|uniref:Protein kinase n=1 Tax=Polyangium jinanense TaxID=2829994 RepID=A0A9X3X5G2_9BACT|nr:protein kinase [Polyangium jinanense]MDC3958627.1 protein kinase [Polyangium jinanense]MDC3983065.1 protein kinase [Polyangium jinanense]
MNPDERETAERSRTHAEASRRLEEACDFTGAAREALLAGDARRAARLGALGGDDATAREAIARIAERLPREVALAAASDLGSRGFGKYAAALYALLGEHAEAASAFVAAGEVLLAAESFERAGQPAEAARALESALRQRPDQAAPRLALGALLARHGRTEGAIKALQQIDVAAPERAAALPLLARCFEEVGLAEAARETRAEMARLGVREEPPAKDAPREAARKNERRGGGVVLFGRYETTREIASSAHARLVEAIDRISGERVAVKIFSGLVEGAGRDALQRFEREARALERLRHPNVVPLHQYVPEGPAMVLAFMRGGSLADKMREGPMAPARAVEIACLLLSALGEAHRLGILHRDVKPANVLFDDAGTAMLSDFGAAHLGDLSSTATAGAIGTYAYMSPEQRLGRPAGIASDLYAVGAVLYELLTGEAAEPMRGRFHGGAPSEKNPELGPEHDAAVAALLAEEPDRRPEDAFQARRALSALRWPEALPKQWTATNGSERPAAPREGERLGPPLALGDGRDMASLRHDAWLDREVLVLPMDEASLARARAFARTGHPALPTVLRVDRAAGEIWVAPPLGKALADAPRTLDAAAIERLRQALAALAAVGGAHGYVDAQHLYWFDGELELAWPRKPATPDAVEKDLAAIDALARGMPPAR